MHDTAAIITTRASGSHADAGMLTPRISPPTTSENIEVIAPLTTTGSERPRNSASRLAGVVSTMPSVWVHRSPATVLAIANRHGIAEYCTALPIT